MMTLKEQGQRVLFESEVLWWRWMEEFIISFHPEDKVDIWVRVLIDLQLIRNPYSYSFSYISSLVR